jgi:Ca-activated chloride channel family protein
MKIDSLELMKTALRPFVLCGLALFAVALTSGQSAEDVHIVPRSTPTGTPVISVPDMVPADGSGAIYAHTSPFRVNVDLVLVPVTVTDAMQRPVMKLSRHDFSLYEDEKPQDIRYFSAEPEPISIAVLLDVSKSMANKLETERAAVREFFQNADPKDEYFVIAFSHRPRLVASSTQSIDELEEKLTTIESGGPTAMLDAVYLAQSQLRSARYNRKAILLITDGGDNASRFTLREIKDLAQESDVQIYAIGLFETFFFNTLEEKMGKKWLREITDSTGGRTVTIDSQFKLPGAAAEISREMRNEYILGYRRSRGVPNSWRKIRVQVNSSAGEHPLRASYKRGYLAAE